MSLLVWLPLINDIKNKGLLDLDSITPSSNSMVFTNEGKIGSNSGSGSIGWHLSEDILDNIWSITTWIKSSSFGSANNVIFCKNTSSGSDCLIYFSIIGGTSLSLGVNGLSLSFYGSYTFNLNTWYHVAATYDGIKASLYVNGILLNSKNITTDKPSNRLNIRINGRSANTDNTSGGAGTNYSFNDFRLYNHCLSSLEVKEIALGLILHYKLDLNFANNPVNVYPAALSSFTNWRPSWVTAADIGDNSDPKYIYNYPYKTTSRYFGPSSDSAEGSYVISYTTPTASTTGYRSILFIVKGKDEEPVTDSWCWPNWNNNDASGPPKNKWSEIIPLRDNFYLCKVNGLKQTSNALVGLGCSQGHRLYVSEAIAENDVLFCSNYLHFEKLEKVIDSSGYNNHGTVYGAVTMALDSARYKNCIYIPSGKTDYIQTNEPIGNPEDAITVNLWIKSTGTGANGYHEFITSVTTPRQMEMGAYTSNGKFRSGIHVNGTRYVNNYGSNILDGYWHMITMTYDGAVIKRYVDAELVNETIISGILNCKNNKFRIGGMGNDENYYTTESYLSDVRIYAVALDENAIKNLYNISMKIDNLNNIHTFKIEELNKYSRELIADEILYTPYNSSTTYWTGYNENGEIYMTGTCSLGTRKTILINPSGHSFYYDFTISANVGNYIFLLFSRYDANYTLRTNDATISVYAGKLTASINHKRIQGIVDLSTDGENPCKYIKFRVFCGYNGYEGDNPYLIIHSMSLREVKATQTLKILKNGIFLTDTITEDIGNILFKKLGMTYANEFIER